MTATTANAFAAAQSSASAMNRNDSSAQTGSIVHLASVFAIIRAALVIVADTFAVATIALLARAKSAAAKTH